MYFVIFIWSYNGTSTWPLPLRQLYCSGAHPELIVFCVLLTVGYVIDTKVKGPVINDREGRGGGQKLYPLQNMVSHVE